MGPYLSGVLLFLHVRQHFLFFSLGIHADHGGDVGLVYALAGLARTDRKLIASISRAGAAAGECDADGRRGSFYWTLRLSLD